MNRTRDGQGSVFSDTAQLPEANQVQLLPSVVLKLSCGFAWLPNCVWTASLLPPLTPEYDFVLHDPSVNRIPHRLIMHCVSA